MKTILFLVYMIICFTLFFGLYGKKVLNLLKNSNKIEKTSQISQGLNYTDLFPVVDFTYENGLFKAITSDSPNENKFYFCGNLTLANKIQDGLYNDIKDFKSRIVKHTQNLINLKGVPLLINNTASGYPVNNTIDYNQYVKNMKLKYSQTYYTKVLKIEMNLKNTGSRDILKPKCENYVEEYNKWFIEKSEKSNELIIVFTELTLNLKDINIPLEHKTLFKNMTNLLQKVNGLINDYMK